MKRDRRAGLAAWLLELKSELVCRDCRQDHPACLVFHHLDPEAKDIAVADAIRLGWGRARITQEIGKCIVLCANCHLKLHARERHDGA